MKITLSKVPPYLKGLLRSPLRSGEHNVGSTKRDTMKTKHLVRFYNRVAHYDADIELADIVKINTTAGKLHTPGAPYLFDGLMQEQHPRLAVREPTTHNRRLAINHLKATLCASFLKDVYEDATFYLLAILQSAARNGLDPDRLIGEHKVSFEGNDILAAGDWSTVVKMVATSVFRRLENERTTKELLKKMNAKLMLEVPQKKIDNALPYFEIRHLLVHADGVADKKFCISFPAFGATPGKKIKLDHRLLQAARKATLALVEAFDGKVVANEIIAPSEMQP